MTKNKSNNISDYLRDSREKKATTLDQIQASYGLGIQYYQQRDLKLAEQEFIKVLRTTESKPSNKSLYVKTTDVKEEVLGSIYHLGLIYLENNNYFNNYAKAASIFQYCAKFAEIHEVGVSEDFLRKAYIAEQQFLESIGINSNNDITEDEYSTNYHQKIANYKDELLQSRTSIQGRLDDISELTIESIAERAEAIEKIYRDSTNFFVNSDPDKNGLVQRLINECYTQLGNPPVGCEYSIIGLGSLAGAKMTPWSDLEFAILINEDKEEYKEYFRNLTKLLNIKVINFGETMLRGMGIEALNNFRIGEGGSSDWFWDSTVMTSGFSFDGTHPHACKLPFGRNGYNGKKDFELILTPEQMASFQKGGIKQVEAEIEGVEVEASTEYTHDWFKSDKHLVQSLRTVSLIDGNQELLDNYRQQIKATEDEVQYQIVLRDRALEILEEDINKFTLKEGVEEEGKLLDVKRDIYRLGDRIIDALANYYDILPREGQTSLSTWQVIDVMQEQEILSSEGAQHLKEALSVATELRLSTYCHNQGQQSETMSTYVPPLLEHLNEEQRKKLTEKTFHIKDTSILHHFYYIMLSVQIIIRLSLDSNEILLSDQPLYTDSNYVRGTVHARFLEYNKALKHIKASVDETPNNLIKLKYLLLLHEKLGQIEDAVKIAEKILELNNALLNDANHPDIAACYFDLGKVYFGQSRYIEAASCYSQSLKINNELHNPNHRNIIMNLSGLGNIHFKNGEYYEAINYYKIILEKSIVAIQDNTVDERDITSIYNNLGLIYTDLGEYDVAVHYYKEVFILHSRVYENRPNHSKIATNCHNLGNVYFKSGKYDKAVDYYNQALNIRRVAYDHTINHPKIADNYNNLGNVYKEQGEYDKAIQYYQQALNIRIRVYDSNSNHPDIAESYNNLGTIYKQKGENDDATYHFQQAFNIYMKSYEHLTRHPDIAMSCNNLGNICYSQRKFDKAFEYYATALALYQEIYSSNLNHPDIAMSLNNLGGIYKEKLEFNNAIKCCQQALNIYKELYRNNPNHPDIAMSLSNLGDIYQKNKNIEESIGYFKQALKIYKNHPNHPEIAACYKGLGSAYIEQKIYDNAIINSHNALAIYKNLYNQAHIYIAETHYNLSLGYFGAAQYEEAYYHTNESFIIFSELKNSEGTDRSRGMRDISLLQLGNAALLSGEIDIARSYYKEISPNYEKIEFSSQNFIMFQSRYIIILYNNHFLTAAINCQLLLLKVDPELQYENYYHNLACYYACHENIEEANGAFINALNHPNAAVTAALHAEYAQFLILNRNSNVINVNPQEISSHLYAAINNIIVRDLYYGSIEQKTVCDTLRNIINEKGTGITINPKVLSYYLLISNPEYIVSHDKSDLLKIFEEYCNNLQEEVSFVLLSYVFELYGNKELSKYYSKYAHFIAKLDDLNSGKITLDSFDSADIRMIQELATKLDNLGRLAILEQRIDDAVKCYTKIFHIYDNILTENQELAQLAISNLTTALLLSRNIDQFITFKSQFWGEVNQELLNLSGPDIDKHLNFDKEVAEQIITFLQNQHSNTNSTVIGSTLNDEFEMDFLG